MMENTPPRNVGVTLSDELAEPQSTQSSSGRKRSGSGGSILSKFPFMRTSESRSNLNESKLQHQAQQSSPSPSPEDGSRTSPRALAAAISQQQHTGRRRKGSLRKVALLGRGAARDRKERESLLANASSPDPAASLDTSGPHSSATPSTTTTQPTKQTSTEDNLAFGLGITGVPSATSPIYSNKANKQITPPNRSTSSISEPPKFQSPSRSPTETTDDEDVLSMPSRDQSSAQLSSNSLASMSSAFFAKHKKPVPSLQRRRSHRTATSPLSLQDLTASPLPQPDEDHDYSETEWWGWVIMIVTWFVFVIGMGSCFNIWSWAWDVGTTPYAPPELEDDPTLPIVGYYPCLMILTTIMAWVWVIIAWMGMKYFRHSKVAGE